MRAIFHLGTYKTGSSSLQDLLWRNRDTLLARGILYPRTGLAGDWHLGPRHTPLIHKYMRGEHGPVPAELLEEIRGSGCHTVILSSEAWSQPVHLAHLSQAIAILDEHGFTDFTGVLVLRNLAAYMVSHYREFTVNRSNALPYARYIAKPIGLFDYLFLTQAFRAQFGSDLGIVAYDAVEDSPSAILDATGLGALRHVLEPGERANTKALDAPQVEAMRCANEAGAARHRGAEALARLLDEEPELKDERWTERVAGDAPVWNAAYRRRFARLSGWDDEAIERLFAVPAVEGRNVGELTGRLMRRLTAEPAA